MATIATIINLLSIILPEYQEAFLINELNNFYNFKHNIFWVDSSADLSRFINNTNQLKYTPQSVYVFQTVDDNITGLYDITKITSNSNIFFIVVAKSANFESNSNLLARIKKMQRLQINLKIGVFFSTTASSTDLQKLFKWCWTYRIVNIFAAYSNTDLRQASSTDRSINVFVFKSFGTFEMVNLTGNATYDNFFLNPNSNFQQLPLKVVWRVSSVKPSDTKLWNEIIRVTNVSISKLYMNTSVSRSQSFENSSVDIVAECGGINYQSILYTTLYPMEQDAVIIAVPEALPYADFSAFMSAVASDSLLGFSISTALSSMLVLSFLRYIKRRKLFFFQSVTDVVNLLMNDNGFIKYQRLSRVEVFLIVPLTFIGK